MLLQTVGELDEDDANVVDHRQQHLADVLRLSLFLAGKLNLVDLGDALDDVGNLLAELALQILAGDGRVFHRVVQQAGGDGGGVHLHLGEHGGDFQGMDEVGFARGAGLARVVALGEFVRLADQLKIVARPVLLHHLQQGAEAVDQREIGLILLARRRHA
jgi:hypothetical protein